MSSLTLVHARYQLVELSRIPMAIIGAAFFPAASLFFFVVPNTKDDPAGATLATASMVVFAAMISNLFCDGSGVAEVRSHSGDPSRRALS
ncbi:ABC transporter permease, partial [Streptomyces anulatus]